MKGHDTTAHRQVMLNRLRKQSGRVSGVSLIVLCIAVAFFATVAPWDRLLAKPKPVTPAPAVNWIGSPVFAQAGGGTGHLTNVEFGIREDGVVLWRDKRGPSVNGRRFGQFEMPPDSFRPAPPLRTP